MELRTNSTENINDGNMSEDDAEAQWSEFQISSRNYEAFFQNILGKSDSNPNKSYILVETDKRWSFLIVL